MTLDRLPACIALVLLSACRTIDAPVQADGTEGDGDSSSSAGVADAGASNAAESGPSDDDTDDGVDTGDGAVSVSASATDTDGPTSDDPTSATTDSAGTDTTDADSSGGGTDSTDSGVDETGAVEPMPCDSTCIALPGGEWQGPVRVSTGSADVAAPGCSEAWGVEVDELFSEPSGAPAHCECSCGEAEDVTCPQTLTLNRKPDNGVNCAAAPTLDSYQISPGCNPIGGDNDDSRWDLVVPGPVGGSCDPIAVVDIDPPTFDTRYTLCGQDEPPQGECNGGQTCVAESDAPLCVYAEGDVECPGNGFGVKHLVYDEQVEDSRGCTACTCGEPEGTCQSAGIDMYTFDNSCMPEMFSVPFDLPQVGCVATNFNVFDASYPNSAIPVPQTSCDAGVSSPIGSLEAQPTMTLCCNG